MATLVVIACSGERSTLSATYQSDWSGEDVYVALVRAGLVERTLAESDDVRRFDHVPEWSAQVQVATFQTGGGDHLVVIRAGSRSAVKGFAHESPSSPYAQPDGKPLSGMYGGMPDILKRVVDRVGFPVDDVTFALWQEKPSRTWMRGVSGENDGLEVILRSVPFTAQDCIDRWDEVLERDLTPEERETILAIYAVPIP